MRGDLRSANVPTMSTEHPPKTIRELTANYLINRRDFYSALAPRIPDAGQRTALRDAAEPVENDPRVMEASGDLPDVIGAGEFLKALGLRDLLKKSGYGRAQGLTAISIYEALQRAQAVEETGLLWFEHLLADYPDLPKVFSTEIQKRQTALSRLLKLEDSLRYHRFSPPAA